ncbi:MAG: enoyl-CoA hydratase-related protein [Planctomycetota bacterium]
MTTEPILVQHDGAIATLTINRPEAHNALNLQVVEAMEQALQELAGDAELAALIITGAGNKAFVAGADISQLRDRGAAEAFRRINQGLFRRVEEFPAPTLAAVGGWALGGGCELAMACDLRVAAETARFGQPEVGLGIIPAAGGTHRLERLVGVGKARELIFTGVLIDAVEAHRIGLVNRVVPPERLMPSTMELAGRIAENAVGAVRLAKLTINTASEVGARAQDRMEVLAQAICFESDEKYQRMTKFLEKKKKTS